MQRVSDRAAYTVLLAVGVVCVLAFLLIRLPRANGSVLSADGPGYFSYLHSIIFDGDLDFRNEYAHWPDFSCAECTPLANGLMGNPYSVGPALLWAPFYLAAHALSLIVQSAGFQASVDGYGHVYESAISIASILYVSAGSLLTYWVCRRYFSSYSSLLAVLGMFLASSLLHYTIAAPYMSHGVSFFAVSLFLFVWHPPGRRTYKEWALLGLSAALMTLVRWQNVLYLGVLTVEAISTIVAAGPGRRAPTLTQYIKGGLLAAFCCAVALTPQMLVWDALYGSFIAVPHGGRFFDWIRPELLDYLFSTKNGLYTWHPITLVATLGFVPFWRRDKKVAAALLVALLLQWYLNSALVEWWGAKGFGARRFISAMPLLALGLSALTEWTTERFRRGSLIILAVVTALVGWSLLFELQFSWGFIPQGEAISFHQLTIGKFEMVLQLIERAVARP